MTYEQLVRDFIINFTAILYEAMPFIILGAIIAGVLEELVPQQLIGRLIPKNRPLAIAMGCLLGLIFPMCECGIVPVMRRLLRKGLPLSCCTAYLLAGPIINGVVIFSTYVAFRGTESSTWRDGRGPIMVALRMGGGFVVAFAVALIVERLFKKRGYDLLTPLARPTFAPLPHSKPDEPAPEASASESPAEEHQEEEEEAHERPSAWKRLSNISETALHDFVDITVFLILGALLAAGSRMLLSHEDVDRLSNTYPIFAILVMMLLAIILCLCSEADAFVAASFTTLHPAAKIAFLVLGPMLDFKLYSMYTRVFRPRLIFTIFGSVFVLTFVFSVILYFAWQAFAGRITGRHLMAEGPLMSHDHDHSHGNTFYLDQLCTIAACGGLGGVCLMMFLDGRLKYILTPFFFIPVLAGGIALIAMAVIRAITLWREAGATAAHEHDHEHHHHEHSHDHVHDHEHHHHEHSHDHGHDHGWTPARYAVLMLPIVLYFLNMPNSTFSAEGYGHMMAKDQIDQRAEPVAAKEGQVLELGFKELSAIAFDPSARKEMEGRMGRLKGMYSPRGSDKEFTLFRVKMNCCAADAIPIGVIIMCEENITRIQPKEWVVVEGQIQFHKLQGHEKWVPVLYLKSASQVKPTTPESDYLS